MDLKGITEKAGEASEALEAARRKQQEAEREDQRVREVLRRVQEKEAPLVDYAEALLALTQPKSRSGLWGEEIPAEPRTSPLIVVGSQGKDQHYFIAAKENYVPERYDADDNPRGTRFVGYSFEASVGIEMDHGVFRALPAEERKKLEYLGQTLRVKTIYGTVISEEHFGVPQPISLKDKDSYEASFNEVLANASETVQLVRQSLRDEQLNPRGGLTIPEKLL
ncbi:MAG TPA: hypothetical protein VK963_01720 [Candidatus Saccharimonadales bacterium]|nr:hypothetical protein [Candidatus Saccharimonadales bacterium]